ncbi:MAG: DNA polymerase, partial [Anaerovoracaceae bacterium]|nr:DNA polymerase [Anaerovoracaceae bacterium]
NFMQRSFGERVAMNAPIQGTAADIIKLAMINVYNALKEHNLRSRLILQVHDELILCAPKKDEKDIRELLKNDMQDAIELSVKLVADVNEGYTWYDLK